MKNSLKYALILAGLHAGLGSAPVMAHITAPDLGTYDGAGSMTKSGIGIGGNYGWADGTDNDWGDAHHLNSFRFTLLSEADVTLTFQSQAFIVESTDDGDFWAVDGFRPGFSLFEGLPHGNVKTGGLLDHDQSVGSVFIRDRDSGNPDPVSNPGGTTEGSFRAANDWSITNESWVWNTATNAWDHDFDDGSTYAETHFNYMGHAYDGTLDYGTGVIAGGDGVEDGMVSKTFHLAAGDYTGLYGGADYLAQDPENPDFGTLYGVSFSISVASAVPEPETYAMLLAGLGLIGAMARRRKGIVNNSSGIR